MSMTPSLSTVSESAARGAWADYLELCKPRLVSLVLFTTGIGFIVGNAGGLTAATLILLIHTVLGTALVACGSMAMNQVLERDTDGLMRRTCSRPVPQGRVGVLEAWVFGLSLAVAGVVYLFLAVNVLATGLAALTCVIYLAMYTPLKRLTTFNTIVGAVSGAIPPMIGYAAGAGRLDVAAWVLFGILFIWQVPHFLGIAWMCREDYARAGLKMLPVIDRDGRITSRQITLYALTLLPVSLLPTPAAVTGMLYLVGAAVFGLGFILCTLPLLTRRDGVSARQVFIASVIYLPLLLLAMMADRV